MTYGKRSAREKNTGGENESREEEKKKMKGKGMVVENRNENFSMQKSPQNIGWKSCYNKKEIRQFDKTNSCQKGQKII